jgi:hypothetical protein
MKALALVILCLVRVCFLAYREQSNQIVAERGIKLSLLDSYEDSYPIYESFLTTSCNPNSLPNIPLPNTITFGGRISTYQWRGENTSSQLIITLNENI